MIPPRLPLALDLLAWTAVAMLFSALAAKALYHIAIRHDAGLRERIRRGTAPHPGAGLAWWVWAPAIPAVAWLLSGWVR